MVQKQERIQKERGRKGDRKKEEAQSDQSGSAQALKEEMDDILKDIDEALGENAINAQEFVSSYVQKGGQIRKGFRSQRGGQCNKVGTWNKIMISEFVPSVIWNYDQLED